MVPRLARSAAGHTVVEVLVALTILSIGLLVQAGAVTALMRIIDRGRTADRSATTALTRLEDLRLRAPALLVPCQGAIGSGTVRHPTVLESWSGVQSGRHVVATVVTTRFDRGTPLVDTVSTAAPC